jgi:hypothetical protein
MFYKMVEIANGFKNIVCYRYPVSPCQKEDIGVKS